MSLVRRRFGFGLTLAIILLPAGSVDPQGFDRANLDLPYNAGVGDADEEEWVEIVHFYGVSFEANAIVFCLDESKSMDKEGRWASQKREITRAISELSSHAMFGIVVWGQDVHTFRKSLVPATTANKQAALHFLGSRRLTIGQALSEGLISSLKLIQNTDAKRPAVVLTSDGRPNNTDNGQLYADSLASNPGRRVKVHTVLVGQRPDSASVDLMRRLASLHGGHYKNAP